MVRNRVPSGEGVVRRLTEGRVYDRNDLGRGNPWRRLLISKPGYTRQGRWMSVKNVVFFEFGGTFGCSFSYWTHSEILVAST